jgi:hypothetical protein
MIVASGIVRAYPGESVSGDAFFIEGTPQGLLIALVDGLGHGPIAAEAAKLALETIRTHASESPVTILEACHQKLLRGRGAAISIVRIDHQGRGTFSGVGNVSTHIYPHSSKDPVFLPSAGVIGHRFRPLRETTFRLPNDGVGVLHSDGVSSRLDPIVPLPGTISARASALLSTFGRTTDDPCLVLFAHRGGGRFAIEGAR